jgi:hypothetical protein
MKTLAIIGVIVLVVIAAILIYAATKPDSFRVQRTVAIEAPPEKIFPHINELKRWMAWSPYDPKDPGMKRSYSGPEGGKGAVYEWDGNGSVGKGRMEIVEATSPGRVLFKLDFIKPFEGHNMAEFTLEPGNGQTNVTWAFYGPSPYYAKVMGVVMGLFMNMDDMVGNDFVAGLANLKAVVEKK